MIWFIRLAPMLISGVVVAFMWWQTAQDTREQHRAAVAALNSKLLACRATVRNNIEDMESDNAIDNIPDAELRNVPRRWLLPPSGT